MFPFLLITLPPPTQDRSSRKSACFIKALIHFTVHYRHEILEGREFSVSSVWSTVPDLRVDAQNVLGMNNSSCSCIWEKPCQIAHTSTTASINSRETTPFVDSMQPETVSSLLWWQPNLNQNHILRGWQVQSGRKRHLEKPELKRWKTGERQREKRWEVNVQRHQAVISPGSQRDLRSWKSDPQRGSCL